MGLDAGHVALAPYPAQVIANSLGIIQPMQGFRSDAYISFQTDVPRRHKNAMEPSAGD